MNLGEKKEILYRLEFSTCDLIISFIFEYTVFLCQIKADECFDLIV